MAPMDRRAVGAWALYDFANSAFTTLVVTFIFSAYFTQRIAPDVETGTILWTRAVNVSAVIVALAMPLLGAIADSSSRRKQFLLITTLQCVLFTALLAFAGPGDALTAVVLFVIANIGFEAANVFYNAFLPELSTSKTIGRISGVGWGLGYVGGLLCLVIALGMIRSWVPQQDDWHVRSTTLLVAGWYAVFAVPLFLFVRESRGSGPSPSIAGMTREGVARLRVTLTHLRTYREAAKLLLARLIYNDGLVTVFSFAAIFAAAAFGMTPEELIVLGITINVAAGLGSFVFGIVNDRIGGKRTIAITLVVLIAASVMGAMAQQRSTFWIAALALGLMVGPNQSASRSLLGSFVPANRQAEFFGFFAFSGKLASVAGPLSYGLILGRTGSQRLAMGSVAVFFLAGLILLLLVDEKRGRAAAEG